WPWWIVVLFALIVAETVLAFAIYKRGRWTTGLAVINTVLAVLFASWALTLLGRGQLVNPEFLDFVVQAGGEGFAAGDEKSAGQGGIFGILAAITGLCLVFFPAWDITDGWIKTRRAQRGQ